MKKSFREMQERMQQNETSHVTEQPRQTPAKPSKEDYIEFEEVRD